MESSSEALTRLVIQLAVILFAAKIGGEICERYVRIPAVIGELLAGMIIGLLFLSGREILGPLFLGEREIPGLGLLFEHIGGGREGEAGFGIPVSDSLWAISQIGAIVLLFIAGLVWKPIFACFFAMPGQPFWSPSVGWFCPSFLEWSRLSCLGSLIATPIPKHFL